MTGAVSTKTLSSPGQRAAIQRASAFSRFLSDVVIVAAARIDRDRAALAASARRQRIVLGRVIEAEHDDGARLGPQRLRVAAPLGGAGEPAHVAVIAAGEELGEIGARLGGETRLGEADRVEAQRQRAVADRRADRAGHRRSAAAAIGRDAGIGQPQPVGRRAGLVEHVDRHAAARIPIAADAQPARRERRDQPAGDAERAILVEGAVIAERAEKELQRLALDGSPRRARSR